MRKTYGAPLPSMCGLASESDVLIAWNIVFHAGATNNAQDIIFHAVSRKIIHLASYMAEIYNNSASHIVGVNNIYAYLGKR